MKQRTKLSLLALAALSVLALLFVWFRQRPSAGASPAATATAESATSAPAATAPAAVTNSQGQQPAPPFPSLLAEARIGRPGPDARPISDRFEKAPVLWTTERAGGANNEFIQRIRLVRTEMKYPLVRLEEVLRRTQTNTGSPEELLLQLAMVGDHVLVKPNANMSADQFAASVERVGGRVRTRLRASGNYLVEIAATNPESMPQQLAALRATGVAPVAEPDYIVHTCATPNDPSFSSLWAMNNTGGANGTADADIDAPEAWDIATGSRNVLVGVIDSGIDYTHPDLTANIWTNPGEIPGNGIDDDNNGFIDDIHGWDFCNDDSDPMDDHSHGTHCAGTIGAVGDNGIGVAGVNWKVSLVALKFIASYGSGAVSDAIEAVSYANKIGVALTSNSWGGGGFSQLLKDAIDAAGTQGRLFIAAAGNAGHDNDTYNTYPTGYTSPNIVAVAATDSYDQLASFSNFGRETVDIAAPGVDVLSTIPDGRYDTYSGTSMATPHVAGAAALLKAAYPQLGGAEIKSLLLASTTPLPALTGKVASGGRLNLRRAIAAPRHLIVAASEMHASGAPFGPFVDATGTCSLRNLTSSTIEYRLTCSQVWVKLSTTAGSVSAGNTGSFSVSLDVSAETLPVGRYSAEIRIIEPASGQTASIQAFLEVIPPVVRSFPLDNDPGWSRTGQWAFGPPGGAGATTRGHPDPTAGHTGANVFGINLEGDYRITVTEPEYLTAGPIDLRGYTHTQLRYSRWLNQDSMPFTRATVEISIDGVYWSPLWENRNVYEDTEWTEQLLDLSAYADNQAKIYLRWGHSTDFWAYAYSGWNIDDIEILGQGSPRTITFAPLAEVSESTGTISTYLQIAPAPIAPTTVLLTSGQPTVAGLPPSVTVPAGATSVPVTITIRDDALLNGTREVFLSARAATYSHQPIKLLVRDNESATLGLSIPANGLEGGPSAVGTITCSAAPASDVWIQLTVTPENEIVVPSKVILLAGATSARFPIAFANNQLIEHVANAQVVASVAGWTSAAATIAIQDNEPTNLAVKLPTEIAEGDGQLVGAGRVKLEGTTPVALVMSLTSSDPGELSVPATVVIPAGAAYADFDLTAHDDGIPDGPQPVTIAATAVGFSPGQAATFVADAAVDHFTFEMIPSPQYRDTAFNIQIAAWNRDGLHANGFRGPVSVSASSQGSAIPGSVTISGFRNGVSSSSLVFSEVGVDLVLHASGGNASGVSNPFQVRPPQVRSIALANTGLAYSAQTNRLYLSTSAGTLVSVDPDTLNVGTPSPIASTGITKLVSSGDGSQLYAVHSNSHQIARVPCATLTPAASFAIGTAGETVADLAVPKGEPLATVVALSSAGDARPAGVAVFDDGRRRPVELAADLHITSLVTGSGPARIYAANSENSSRVVVRATVTPQGITQLDQRTSPLKESWITGSGSLMADAFGHVFDAEEGRYLGTLLWYPKALVCLDAAARRAFLLLPSSGQTYRLRCFNTATFDEIGAIEIPDITGIPTCLQRWGANGLAFRTDSQVVILHTDFIPTNASADLSLDVVASPTPATIDHPVTYSLRVTNLGGLAASGIILNDRLPANTTFVAATTTQGSVSNTTDTIIATIGSLPAGATATINLQVIPRKAGEISNLATVSAATTDPFTVNNQVATSTTVDTGWTNLVRSKSLQSNGLASDGEHLYVTLSSDSPSRPNSVGVLDPTTFALLRTIPVGSNPGLIALTDDLRHAHVELRGSYAMVPLDLSTAAAGIPVPFDLSDQVERPFLANMVPLPNSNTSIAISLPTRLGNRLSIYDNGAPRTDTIRTTSYQAVARATDPAHLYLYNTDFGSMFETYAITASGLSLVGGVALPGGDPFSKFKSMGDVVVSSSGAVIDGRTGSMIATLGACDTFAVDADNQRIYRVTGGGFVTITAYDTHTWHATGSLVIGEVFSPVVLDIVRWGRHGLAFITGAGQLFSVDAPTLIPDQPLRVVLPSDANEGDGTLPAAGRVELVYPAEAPLVVALASSAPDLVRIPTTVTIPQGAKAAVFDLVIPDNNIVNSTTVVTITPAASGLFNPQSATISVHDDEGAPTLAPEPVWTAGSTNEIHWTAIFRATAYQAECATDSSFTTPIGTGWITETQTTVKNLADGTKYFYRVRARTGNGAGSIPEPWSAVVSSTQDASGPDLALVPAPPITTSSTYTFTGTTRDTSGVASVTVSATLAATNDGFAHWSLPVTLQEGWNWFYLRAVDNVLPQNESNRWVSIFRISPTTDQDGDGFSDLLEYAFGLNPLVANATGAPTASLQTNPGDGLSYLVFTYRRRVLRDDLTYHVETAPDLSTWTEVVNPVEVAATPNGDGLTETVTVRLQPAISAATPRRFVRLKVTTP